MRREPRRGGGGAATTTTTTTLLVFLFTTVPITTIQRESFAAAFVASTRTAPTTRRAPVRHMFTGIVEDMGQVVALEEKDDMLQWDGSVSKGTELTVRSPVALDGAYLGCSIAVNGVCLTATALDGEGQTFCVGLSPETLRRSSLGELQAGQAVNIERAASLSSRNSGHFVQGHVDGIGRVVDKQVDGNSLVFRIQPVGWYNDAGTRNQDAAAAISKYIVSKGFIAVDGASLTVVETFPEDGSFSFMLVEYTQKKIIVTAKEVGDVVNLEVDVLSKYAEQSLQTTLGPTLEALQRRVTHLEDELERVKQQKNQ